MKFLINSLKFLVLILAILFNTGRIYGQESNQSFKVLWQKDFGCDENLSYCLGAIAFNKVNNTLLIMGTSFDPKNYSDAKFWLWEIDENGNKIRSTLIKEVPEGYGSAMKRTYMLIKSLTVSPEGDIFAVGEFDGATQSFVKINGEGQIIFSKTIYDKELGDVNVFINKMVPLPDNNFLLIGKDENDGLVIKIDSEGKRLWKKLYDIGRVELFTDGVPISNNSGFLLVGNVVDYVKSTLIGPADIWILECDPEGNIISEESFTGSPMPGKWPQVCQVDSGNFVVAYDSNPQMMAMSTDHRIKAFNPDLNILWDKRIADVEKGPPILFKIIVIPHGFIVANCVNFSDLKIYEFDEKGNNLGSVFIDKGVFSDRFNLIYVKEKAFIISEAFCKDNDILSEIKVTVIQLTKK